jgi:CheY-like chemotaxis protein
MKPVCGSWQAGGYASQGIARALVKQGAPARSDMSHLRGKDGGTRILIADDDGVSRLYCSQSLALSGIRTFLAGSGVAASYMAATHLPDVVIMDAHLQDMSGVDAIACIRQRWPLAAPAPRFIGMTADDSPAVVSALRIAGCQHVLIKPFSSQFLAACIREVAGPDPGSRVDLPAPQQHADPRQLQAKFQFGLAAQLAELDGAVARLDWGVVQRLVHALSGAAALAGHDAVARSGQAVLRRLPPAGPASTVADYYDYFLQRLAEIPPA